MDRRVDAVLVNSQIRRAEVWRDRRSAVGTTQCAKAARNEWATRKDECLALG